MPTDDPRKALARALYTRPTQSMVYTNEMFEAAWTWMLREDQDGRPVADSHIGKIVARADAVLRWIDQAGFEVVRKV